MAKKTKKPLDPIERSLTLRRRGIDRMEENKKRIRRIAEEDCAEIDKRINRAKVLIDAIERRVLAP